MTQGSPSAPEREYTHQDDLDLACWLVDYFGRSHSGRLENEPYELMVADPKYKSWSHRHAWQSWRERYKDHRERIDRWANAFMGENDRPPDPMDDEELIFSPSDSEQPTGYQAPTYELRDGSVPMAGDDNDAAVAPLGSFKQRLEGILSEHGIYVDLVQDYFEQALAKDQSEEEALENTCDYVEKLARDRRRKAGRASDGSFAVY